MTAPAILSSAWAAALQTKVQRGLLANLRDELHWWNPSLAEHGTFDPNTDRIMFLDVPDLSNTTPQTPLTEGTPPTARSISMTPRSFGAKQYGDLVSISDIAKLKAPFDSSDVITERLARVAKEVMNIVTRDEIFSGGTPFYSVISANTVRTDIASTDIMSGAALLKLRATLKKNKVPALPDNTYRCYLSPGQMYDLLADTGTVLGVTEPSKYTETGLKFLMSGEIGMWRGFRLIEANDIPTFSSTTTVYAGLVTGSLKGWAYGDLQTLRTYYTPPGGSEDPLHQQEKFGWKVYFGVGVLSNSFYYRLETAAPNV